MIKAFPFIACLLLASSAFAVNPAWVQSDGSFNVAVAASSQTDTLTHTSSNGNDLIVFISWRTTTRTVTSVCGGTSCTQTSFTSLFLPYTQAVLNGSVHASQMWICHNCPATSVITVRWSGTTVSDTQVEEYSGVSAIGQITSATGTSTTPSVTITTQDANNVIAMVTSSPGNDGVPTSNTGNLRDASRSGTTSSFDAGSACDNNAVSSGTAVTCKVTITSGTWTAQGVELRSATSALTDHVGSVGMEWPPGNEAVSATAITGPMISDRPTLAGNLVVCWGSWAASTLQTPTVTDDKSDTFTLAGSRIDGSTNSVGIFWVAATTGAKYVTWTFGTALTAGPNFTYGCTQFYNAATTTPVDASCGTANEAGPNLTCGSMTTNVNDIIFTVAFADTLNSYGQGLGYCGGGSGYTKLIANQTVGYCSEYTIDTSPAAGKNPALYLPTATNIVTNSFDVVGAAFKISNGAGTAPTGLYIARSWVFDILGAGVVYADLPSNGNLFTFATTPILTTQPQKIWDSNQVSYTWNSANPAGSVPGHLFSSAGSTLDPSSLSLVDNLDAGNDEHFVRDIVGAASSPFDTPTCAAPSSSGNAHGATSCYNSVAQSGGAINNSPNVAPSVSTSTLSLITLQNGSGPVTGLTGPSGSILDCPTFSAQTDVDPFCEGEGHAHFFATSTSSQTWAWTVPNVANTGNSQGWVIKAAPVAASPAHGQGLIF